MREQVQMRRHGRLSRWLREPLLHFAVLGAVVFTVHQWVAPPRATQRIVISDAVLQSLRQEHLRRTGTPPTAQEEAALIQRFADNEMLYREAIAQGLDRGDLIVRRRLVQKMEFVLESEDPVAEPSDAELQAYLDAHAERYAVAARIAFTHVFVGTDRHGAGAERLAAELHDQLAAGADPARLGDPFLHGADFSLRSERDLAGVFGEAFAAQVMTLPTATWSAPVRSSFGWHLVRVSERSAARPATLEDVRPAVLGDRLEERRAAANAAALARLRQRYQVAVEGADGVARGLSAAAEARVGP